MHTLGIGSDFLLTLYYNEKILIYTGLGIDAQFQFPFGGHDEEDIPGTSDPFPLIGGSVGIMFGVEVFINEHLALYNDFGIFCDATLGSSESGLGYNDEFDASIVAGIASISLGIVFYIK